MNSQIICKSGTSVPRSEACFSLPRTQVLRAPFSAISNPLSLEPGLLDPGKKKEKIGAMDTRVPGEPGWPEGEGWGRNAKSWLSPQTPDPSLSSSRPVGSQPQCSPEPAAWQHRGHREGEGDPVGEASGTKSLASLLYLLVYAFTPKIQIESPEDIHTPFPINNRHPPPHPSTR